MLIQDGAIATRVGSLGALTQAGQFYPDDSGHIIYYWATDSLSPATHTMEVGGRYNNLSINDQSYITVNNLWLHGAGGQVGAGVHCVPTSAISTNIVVNNCQVDYAYYAGVWFSHYTAASGDTITISDNQIHHNYTIGLFFDGLPLTYPGQYASLGRFTNVTISTNHIYSNGNTTSGQHGCYIRYTNAPVVLHNEFDHNTGFINWSSGIYLVSSPNAVVKYNISHNNHWDNRHWDVNSNGFVAGYNISYGADHQGYMVEEHYRSDGTSLFTHNLSFNDVSSMYFGPGGTIHVVTGVTVINNIFAFATTRTFGIDLNVAGATASSYFDNTIDNNLYYAPNGTALMQVVAATGPGTANVNYTLAQWMSLTGWGDTNSINADPKFANYLADGTGNYHLALGSLAIGAGAATVADPSTDFDGNSVPTAGRYDLGAYAFVPNYGRF